MARQVIIVMNRKKIVIVGCGIAGNEAAFTALKNNPDAEVTIITEESHTLYSACVLADYVAGKITRDHVFLKTVKDYKKTGISLLTNRQALSIDTDNHELILDNQKLKYDELILATGSKPFMPPISGKDKKGIYSLKTIDDADNILNIKGEHAVVIGSGPVGIEAAMGLKHIGYKVTLIELLSKVAPRLFDNNIANLIKDELQSNDIEVVLGEKVIEFIGNEAVYSVKTDKRELKADIAVLVAGMRPEVKLAEQAGIKLGNLGGIIVDEHLKTNVSNIWACGDCVESTDRITKKTGLYMLWNNARIQGRTAGANATGSSVKYPGSLNITNLHLFNGTSASAGLLFSDISDSKTKTINKSGHLGYFSLVLQNEKLVGVQAKGNTQRVAGLIGFLAKGGDLSSYLKEEITIEKSQTLWSLRTVKKELHKLLKQK